MPGKVIRLVPKIFTGLGIAAAVALVLGLVVQLLWNALLPEVFGLPRISYWQAWGLFFLAHLLLAGGR